MWIEDEFLVQRVSRQAFLSEFTEKWKDDLETSFQS